jgi:hypothetical protein
MLYAKARSQCPIEVRDASVRDSAAQLLQICLVYCQQLLAQHGAVARQPAFSGREFEVKARGAALSCRQRRYNGCPAELISGVVLYDADRPPPRLHASARLTKI